MKVCREVPLRVLEENRMCYDTVGNLDAEGFSSLMVRLAVNSFVHMES
jgi:hypothetical protein